MKNRISYWYLLLSIPLAAILYFLVFAYFNSSSNQGEGGLGLALIMLALMVVGGPILILFSTIYYSSQCLSDKTQLPNTESGITDAQRKSKLAKILFIVIIVILIVLAYYFIKFLNT